VNDYTCKVQSDFKTTKIKKEDCGFFEEYVSCNGQTRRQTIATHMVRRGVRPLQLTWSDVSSDYV